MKSKLLITGADGYLGTRLIRQLLSQSDEKIIAWVRSGSPDEFATKKSRLLASLDQDPSHPDPRLEIATGELRNEAPYEGIAPNEVRGIIHTASVTRFNVEEDLARSVNYEGSIKTFRFAQQCKNLEKLIYVSTVYASGLRTGAIPETPLDDRGFGNHYEGSKWRTENTLVSEFNDLPWTIARVATVIADQGEGKVVQYNVFHNTLKLLYYGLISLIPGRTEVPLYFVTGDFVTHGIFEMVTRSLPEKNIYHLVHKRSESLNIGQLLDHVFDVFSADKDFAARGILRPLLADEETFDILAKEMDHLSRGIVNQALSSIRPFAKQLFIEKDFANDNSVQFLSRYKAPDPALLVRNAAKHLVTTKWGRK